MLSRGQTLGSVGGRGQLGAAAAAAGVTPVSAPVVDNTLDGGYDNVNYVFGIGTVVAGGRCKLEVYTCDDAAGTNPVLVTASDWVVPVANRAIVFDVVGVPGYYMLCKLVRDTANISYTGGWITQYGRRSAGVSPDPHATVPWN